MKKSILFTSLLLAFFFLSGTSVLAAESITISSVTDFNDFAQTVNTDGTNADATVTLDIPGGSLDFGGQNLTPIGTESHPFTGSFDGNSNTITNFTMATTVNNLGIFGVTDGAQISNLKVELVNIEDTTFTIENLGGIVGYAQNSTIASCTYSGNLRGKKNIGGIVGLADNTTTISQCEAVCNTMALENTGGIAGMLQDSSITNCQESGQMEAFIDQGRQKAGGIAGFADTSTISDCIYSGSLYGASDVGGIVGKAQSSAISGCQTSGTYQATAISIGGIVGLATDTDSSSSSSDDANQITNCSSSATISPYAQNSITSVGGIAGTNSCSNIADCSFTGSISGFSYIGGITGALDRGSISNCAVSGDVSGTTDYIGGIAGSINGTGSIANAMSTSALSGPAGSTGGIAGSSSITATISNVYYLLSGSYKGIGSDADTAEIHAVSDFATGYAAWGLQNGQTNPDTNFVWGQTLSASSDPIPVLSNDAAKQVYQLSFTKANASPTYSYVNPGDNYSIDTPTTDYTWMDEAGNAISPGTYSMSSADNNPVDLAFVETQAPAISTNPSSITVINDHETVNFTITPANGIASTGNYRYRINDGAWQTVTGTSSFTASNLPAGTPTISVQQEITSGTWSIAGSMTLTCLATNTAHTAILISSPADFNAFATYINYSWYMNSSIVDAQMTGNIDFTVNGGTVMTRVNNYEGNFDGSGYTLTLPTNSDLCPFGYLYGTDASIKNLTVSGNITTSTSYIGGIVSVNTAVISDCTYNGSVTSTANGYVGGIAGSNGSNSSITGCTVSGDITGTTYIGGIAGYATSSQISDCQFTGSVTGVTAVGGISGYGLKNTIQTCTVSTGTGKISGTNNGGGVSVGGIVGESEANTFENCAVTASLEGSDSSGPVRVGGIEGYSANANDNNAFSTISNSYYDGRITYSSSSTNMIGGILGDAEVGVNLTNSYYLAADDYDGIGADGLDNDIAELHAITTFNDGAVAWGLQENQTSQVWGQALSGTVDADPILTSDSTKKVYQLNFYNSTDDLNNNSTPAYTRYANNGGTTVDFPSFAPGSNARWLDGTTEFTSQILVTSDLNLVKEQSLTMSVTVASTLTTTVGSTPAQSAYSFGNLPTGYTIYYSTDVNRAAENYSTTPPTYSTAGTVTVYFKITAPAYVDDENLSTTVTVNTVNNGGGGGTTPSTPAPPDTLFITWPLEPISQVIDPTAPGTSGQLTVGPPQTDDVDTGASHGAISRSPFTYNLGAALLGGSAGSGSPSDAGISGFIVGSVSDPNGILNSGNGDNGGDAGSGGDTGNDGGDTGSDDDTGNDGGDTGSDDTGNDGGDTGSDDTGNDGSDTGSADGVSVDGQGVVSGFLNYIPTSPGGFGATSPDQGGDSNGTDGGQAADPTNDGQNGSDDQTDDSGIQGNSLAVSDTTDDTSEMLTATVVINVTMTDGTVHPVTIEVQSPQRTYNVAYRTHIQNLGWEDTFVENGEMSGTQGLGLRLEAIEIQMDTTYDLGLSYRTHVENIGWEEDYATDGQESGTDGRGLRLEAIELALTGEDAQYFDVYYQVHVQNLGWLDWASNGDPAGSAGYGYRLEGIHIEVVPKGSDAPGQTENAFVEQ